MISSLPMDMSIACHRSLTPANALFLSMGIPRIVPWIAGSNFLDGPRLGRLDLCHFVPWLFHSTAEFGRILFTPRLFTGENNSLKLMSSGGLRAISHSE